MKKTVIKGYKVFNPDWTCRGFLYEVGKTYEEDIKPLCCRKGFQFCLKASGCLNYYGSDHNIKVAEVIALGEVDYSAKDSKCATNKIQIVREVSWDEVRQISNIENDCTGVCNTGNRNAGDRNTGDDNAGDRNTGNRNAGDRNTGDDNVGDRNTGDNNVGERNTGDNNAGDSNAGDSNAGNNNTGERNTGERNTGKRNTGDCNTGDCNTGKRNTGDINSGNRNTGNKNTGNDNTGDNNAGDRNTGDWNLSSFNSGCFCTDEHEILIFDKPSGMTYREWMNSDASCLLNSIPKVVVKWIYLNDMTDEEKEANPEYETTGGYLKVLDESECGQNWWDNLSEDNRNIIREIPNFDVEKFEKCTGIKVR